MKMKLFKILPILMWVLLGMFITTEMALLRVYLGGEQAKSIDLSTVKPSENLTRQSSLDFNEIVIPVPSVLIGLNGVVKVGLIVLFLLSMSIVIEVKKCRGGES